jgi:branched-subunit amino acid aminotransferase/4-amino-4-deoxychorismate lyase
VFVLIDGEPADHIPVTDSSVLRGDGCFEAVSCHDGVPFALEWHLDRMERSCRLLEMSMPDRRLLRDWCRAAAAHGGDMLRIVVSRGDALPGATHGGRCIVINHDAPLRPVSVRLWPLVARWHPAGEPTELAGAKTLSYAPNLAATRTAVAAGFDDALLLSTEGVVMEGPTFSIGWVVGGVLETPPLDLHILDSITRRVALLLAHRLAIPVREERFGQERLELASEVMVWSTARKVIPVTAVGERAFEPGPVTARLRAAFADYVAEETGIPPV